MNKNVKVLYFSDLLCVWAYVAQIRIDELKEKFGSQVSLQHHFTSVFGSSRQKLEQNWGHRGGIEAYSQHVKDVVAEFGHLEVHPEIWTRNIPLSSTSCHLFLKAIQLLEEKGLLTEEAAADSQLEKVAWQLRVAFFRDMINISESKAQLEIAEQLKLPVQAIKDCIDSGEAFAALELDQQLKTQHQVVGSPTLVFNEGRQKIYGNVGYRVIEANIQELLHHPDNQASWC